MNTVPKEPHSQVVDFANVGFLLFFTHRFVQGEFKQGWVALFNPSRVLLYVETARRGASPSPAYIDGSKNVTHPASLEGGKRWDIQFPPRAKAFSIASIFNNISMASFILHPGQQKAHGKCALNRYQRLRRSQTFQSMD